jgi:methylase of polypeptide subunit release factors
VGDFLGLRGEFDLIVGNPPYAVAASIEITRLEETNKKVRENAARADIEEQLESARAETARLDGEIDQCDAEKAEAMAAASFPVQGLSFRENDGSLLLNGLPLEQAAESQRIRLSVAIGFALNPRLKVLLVRQGSELDSNAMRLLAEIADEHGGQVWVERVSEDGAGCSVVLEDGEVRAEPARAAE